MEPRKKTVWKQSEKDKAWREGFEAGVKANLKENGLAIEIGTAIINALDKRYAFPEKDY